MTKHVVIVGPVEHNGTVYQDQDVLPVLSEEAAAALLAVGVIELQQSKPAKLVD
jgi:hypothetical protein